MVLTMPWLLRAHIENIFLLFLPHFYPQKAVVLILLVLLLVLIQMYLHFSV